MITIIEKEDELEKSDIAGPRYKITTDHMDTSDDVIYLGENQQIIVKSRTRRFNKMECPDWMIRATNLLTDSQIKHLRLHLEKLVLSKL